MKSKFVLDTLPAAHALAVEVLKKADRVFYRQRRIMEDSYGMPHGTLSGVQDGKLPEGFELRTSQLIAVCRDTISYYQDDPARQEQLFRDLVALLRKEILPPP